VKVRKSLLSGDAVREEIVIRFVDVREDSRSTDKSSVALYIE